MHKATTQLVLRWPSFCLIAPHRPPLWTCIIVCVRSSTDLYLARLVIRDVCTSRYFLIFATTLQKTPYMSLHSLGIELREKATIQCLSFRKLFFRNLLPWFLCSSRSDKSHTGEQRIDNSIMAHKERPSLPIATKRLWSKRVTLHPKVSISYLFTAKSFKNSLTRELYTHDQFLIAVDRIEQHANVLLGALRREDGDYGNNRNPSTPKP